MQFTHVLIDHGRAAVYLVANVQAGERPGSIWADYLFAADERGSYSPHQVMQGAWDEGDVSIVKLAVGR